MNVYVESNFVLELALLQEQQEDCKKILVLCESGAAKLVLPAFCIAEPYETLTRRDKHRKNLSNDLNNELGQLLRSESFREEAQTLQGVINLLIRSGEEYKQRLNQTFDRVLSIADIVPLTQNILTLAIAHQSSLDLSPPDAIVYASVLQHLNTNGSMQSCFLNRNSKDFDDPDIVETLRQQNCRLIPRFDDGYSYIRAQLQS